MTLSMPSKRQHLRRYIQLAFATFYIYVGIRFYLYYLWATEQSTSYVSPPAAVEAFLPISGLVALKVWLFMGIFDPFHPAGLSILIFAILSSFLFRKAFCGYFCPVGYVSGLLHRLGKRLGITKELDGPIGRVINVALTIPKYILLAFFLWAVWWNMNAFELQDFMQSTYNQVAASKMLLFFINPSQNSVIAVLTLCVGSLLIPNLWCRAFCPYGALMGICSKFSPVAINRDEKKCISCKRCSNVCPSMIKVHLATTINNAECQGCTECVNVCPQKQCLQVKALGKTIPNNSIAIASLFLLFLIYFIATATGHWTNKSSPEEQKIMHQEIKALEHP